MDDDKQIKELTTRTTIGRFLNRPIVNDERDRETFDLEAEFAKTAKNKSPLVPLSVAAFLLVLAIGAWVASQFTEQASQRSSVSIGSFEDLKLKEIFDTVRKNKKDLEAINGQMDELTQVSNSRVAALTQAGASKADIASVNDATGAQAKAIQAQTALQVAEEKQALALALAPLKAQAAEAQKRIDSYDDRIGQMNKKNQQVLDTQQRLFDLEKQKVVDQYEARLLAQTEETKATLERVKQERDALVVAMKAKQADDIRKLTLKFNPVITEGPIFDQIALKGALVAAYPEFTLPPRVASANVVTPELQTQLADRVAVTQKLLARLREIPSLNSVPPLLNALDNAIADSLAGYDGYLAPLGGHMIALDEEIGRKVAVIAERDTTIAERDGTIVQLEVVIAGLETDLADAATNLRLYEATVAEERAAEAADRAAERNQAAASKARWTGAVSDYVLTLREDGVLIDVRNPQDTLIVLKTDRAQALAAAIDLAAKTPPPVAVPGKTTVVPPPVNLATVRDGANNGELGIVAIEVSEDGAWRAKLVKQNDPKRPFKAFDRITLSLPAKR